MMDKIQGRTEEREERGRKDRFRGIYLFIYNYNCMKLINKVEKEKK